jgi:hypothetical protein
MLPFLGSAARFSFLFSPSHPSLSSLSLLAVSRAMSSTSVSLTEEEIHARLRAHGVVLSENPPPPPIASYIPCVQTGL